MSVFKLQFKSVIRLNEDKLHYFKGLYESINILKSFVRPEHVDNKFIIAPRTLILL